MTSIEHRYRMAIIKGYRITKGGKIIGVRGKELSPHRGSQGYLQFDMRLNGRKVHLLTHRFVAYIKFGEKIFNPNLVVRHINGVQTDNRPENLKLGTASENERDKRYGKASRDRGEDFNQLSGD